MLTRSLIEKRGGVASRLSPQALEQLELSRTIGTEPRQGEWTNSAEWGESYAGVFPKVAGDVITILSNKAIIGPPRSIALTLYRATLERAEPTNADIYAEVTYGAGAAINTLLVDWRGALVLPANSIKVAALGYAPNGSAGYDPTFPTKVRLGCTLGINGATPSEPPTFTTPQFEALTSQALELNVPQFARRVVPFIGQWLNADPLSYQDFVIEISARNGQLLCSYEVSSEILAAGLMIPGQAAVVSLVNYSPWSVRMGAVFQLGL